MPTHDIPAEQQVAFLQKHIVSFKLDVFEELKESLGSKGTEIFKKILERGNKRVNDMAKGLSFQTMAILPECQTGCLDL